MIIENSFKNSNNDLLIELQSKGYYALKIEEETESSPIISGKNNKWYLVE